MVLKPKKPGIAASYIHRQLKTATSSEEAALQKCIHEDLKMIVVVGILLCYLRATNQWYALVVQFGDVSPRVRERAADVNFGA